MPVNRQQIVTQHPLSRSPIIVTTTPIQREEHKLAISNLAKIRNNSAAVMDKQMSKTNNFEKAENAPYFIVPGERAHSQEQIPEDRDATKLRNGSFPIGKDSSATTIIDRPSTGLVINVQPSIAAQQFNTPSNCYQAVSSVNLPRRDHLVVLPTDIQYFHP